MHLRIVAWWLMVFALMTVVPAKHFDSDYFGLAFHGASGFIEVFSANNSDDTSQRLATIRLPGHCDGTFSKARLFTADDPSLQNSEFFVASYCDVNQGEIYMTYLNGAGVWRHLWKTWFQSISNGNQSRNYLVLQDLTNDQTRNIELFDLTYPEMTDDLVLGIDSRAKIMYLTLTASSSRFTQSSLITLKGTASSDGSSIDAITLTTLKLMSAEPELQSCVFFEIIAATTVWNTSETGKAHVEASYAVISVACSRPGSGGTKMQLAQDSRQNLFCNFEVGRCKQIFVVPSGVQEVERQTLQLSAVLYRGQLLFADARYVYVPGLGMSVGKYLFLLDFNSVDLFLPPGGTETLCKGSQHNFTLANGDELPSYTPSLDIAMTQHTVVVAHGALPSLLASSMECGGIDLFQVDPQGSSCFALSPVKDFPRQSELTRVGEWCLGQTVSFAPSVGDKVSTHVVFMATRQEPEYTRVGTIDACPDNEEWRSNDKNVRQCLKCSPGTFKKEPKVKDAKQYGLCTLCPPRTYSIHGGYKCQPCDKSQFCPEGTIRPIEWENLPNNTNFVIGSETYAVRPQQSDQVQLYRVGIFFVALTIVVLFGVALLMTCFGMCASGKKGSKWQTARRKLFMCSQYLTFGSIWTMPDNTRLVGKKTKLPRKFDRSCRDFFLSFDGFVHAHVCWISVIVMIYFVLGGIALLRNTSVVDTNTDGILVGSEQAALDATGALFTLTAISHNLKCNKTDIQWTTTDCTKDGKPCEQSAEITVKRLDDHKCAFGFEIPNDARIGDDGAIFTIGFDNDNARAAAWVASAAMIRYAATGEKLGPISNATSWLKYEEGERIVGPQTVAMDCQVQIRKHCVISLGGFNFRMESGQSVHCTDDIENTVTAVAIRPFVPITVQKDMYFARESTEGRLSISIHLRRNPPAVQALRHSAMGVAMVSTVLIILIGSLVFLRMALGMLNWCARRMRSPLDEEADIDPEAIQLTSNPPE